MAKGLTSFREWFKGFEGNYVVIGAPLAIPQKIMNELEEFISSVEREDMDLKNINIVGQKKEDLLELLQRNYMVAD